MKKRLIIIQKIFSRRCTNQKMTHMISHWDRISNYITSTPLTENYICKKISDFKNFINQKNFFVSIFESG